MEHTFPDHVLLGQPRTHGRFVLAVIAGFSMALVGAGLWMAVTLLTGLHVGIVALGIAVAIGFAILVAGQGTHPFFGLLGAFFTLLSCLAGELGEAIAGQTSESLNFYNALFQFDLSVFTAAIITHTSPLMGGIYVLSAIIAYNLSFRK
jgi:hypothetical protein